MADGPPARSWASVCGDCARCEDGRCSGGYPTSGEEDCIAAICEGFTPANAGSVPAKA